MPSLLIKHLLEIGEPGKVRTLPLLQSMETVVMFADIRYINSNRLVASLRCLKSAPNRELEVLKHSPSVSIDIQKALLKS